MDWFVKAFIKASLAWLAAGVTLGVVMAVHPTAIVYRPAHVHLNLLGFVTMMIYGVAYHVIPRFSGHPLRHPRLAGWHWWSSNAGLALMVVGFLVQPHVGRAAIPLLGAGGTLSALGAYAFVLNLWRTIDGRAVSAPRRVPEAAAGAPARRLAVMQPER